MGVRAQGWQGETSMFILKFYFIFCNCLINRQGPNLSTANQPRLYAGYGISIHLGSFSPRHCFLYCPLPSTTSLPACDILATTIWRMLSRLEINVVAATSAQLPSVGTRKLLRFDRAPSSFCWSQVEVLSVLTSTPLSPPNPRTVAPQRQSNHDTASVVISDCCLFADSVASPHRVIAPPKSWVHSRLAHRSRRSSRCSQRRPSRRLGRIRRRRLR